MPLREWVLANMRASDVMCNFVPVCGIACAVCYGELSIEITVVRDVDVLDSISLNFERALEGEVLMRQGLREDAV